MSKRRKANAPPSQSGGGNPVACGLGDFHDWAHGGLYPGEKCFGDFFTFRAEDYKVQYWNKLFTLMCAQFRITGIESTLISEDAVSRMIVDYGTVAFFFDDVTGELLVLPCQVLKVSIANKVTRVRVFSPWVGSYHRELDVMEGDDFFVCFDSIAFWSVSAYYNPWIHQLSEISVTIDVNTVGLRTPVVTSSNMEGKLSMSNIIWNFIQGIPFISLKKRANMAGSPVDDIKALNLNIPYNIDKLEVERKNLWNTILESIGYKVNVNASKKERLISDEVQGNMEETLGFYDARKRPREAAVKWLNEHGIKAELVEVTKVSDVEGGAGNVEVYDNTEGDSGEQMDT